MINTQPCKATAINTVGSICNYLFDGLVINHVAERNKSPCSIYGQSQDLGAALNC